jgi:hypothetical protein
MPSTYTPIATTTLGSAQSSVTFSSFSGYTDLYIVVNSTAAGNQNILLRFNSDTGTNYSYTRMTGAGSATSNRESSIDAINLYNSSASLNGVMATTIVQVQNYANTTTFKTVLSRGNGGANETNAQVSLYRSTSAITSLTFSIFTTNFSAGSTFTLYGIKAA